jgi:DHA2 family lincomycin resistance protein-like MFS transporter
MKAEHSLFVTMLVLLLGGFLSLLNETILNVALFPIMSEMNVTATMVQWLSTGYVLIVAIMVPISAFLIYTFTTKKLYLGAMGIFGLGTLAAVFSPDFMVLVLARMIQALGTGLLAPIMIDTALASYPREQHGYIMGICTCVILIGPAAGPIISGLVLQFFTWRALFVLLLPFILFCIGGGMIYLKNVIPCSKPKIDRISIMLSTTGFSFLVYGISIVSSDCNWRDILIIFSIGIVSIIFFCKRQLGLREPMLNITAFRKTYFSVCALLVIVVQMVQFSINIVLPLLLEKGMQLTSLQAALTLFPAVLVCSAVTPISGRLYDHIGGKKIIPAGILIMGFGLLVLARIQISSSVLLIALFNMIIYLGIALAWSPMQSHALKQLSLSKQAHGVAIINTFIQLGSALGTPLFVGLMDAGERKYIAQYAGKLTDSSLYIHALYSGFHYSISNAAILIGIAFLFSLLLNIKIRLRS